MVRNIIFPYRFFQLAEYALYGLMVAGLSIKGVTDICPPHIARRSQNTFT